MYPRLRASELAPYGERLGHATQFQERLYAVFAGSRDAKQRAAAAFVLAHTEDGKRLVDAMVTRIADPSAAVRNNVLRVLSYVAVKHPELDISIAPILAAIEFPTTTDRNKAAAVLLGLVKSKPALDRACSQQIGRWNGKSPPWRSRQALDPPVVVGGREPPAAAQYLERRDRSAMVEYNFSHESQAAKNQPHVEPSSSNPGRGKSGPWAYTGGNSVGAP